MSRRLVSLALVHAGLLFSVPVNAQEESAAQGGESRVVSMGALPSAEAWVLTERRLLWSPDGGATWREDALIAPPGYALRGALFSDSSTGWVVSSGASTTDVARTSDGGETWEHSIVSIPGDETPSDAFLSFIDGRRGWLALRLPSSTNLSRGVLFQTTDGGRTWQLLPSPPMGDTIRFVSERDGWIAGGPGNDLFVTRDGGDSWSRTTVGPPIPGARLTYSLPVFEGEQDGLLPVRVEAAVGSTIALYASHDGGRSWDLAGRADGAAQEPGPLDLRGGTVIATGSGSTIVTLTRGDEGVEIRRRTPAGLPSRFGITRLSFAGSLRGWATAEAGQCAGVKVDCWRETRVLRTTDGGATFEDVTPPLLAEANRAGEARARRAPRRESSASRLPEGASNLLGSGTRLAVNEEGFDIACYPSLPTIQDWWDNSPYRYVGTYIGGTHAYCVNHSSTCPCPGAAWFSQTASIGWSFIPTWVGLQEMYGDLSSDTAVARGQGVSEADLAANRLSVLGFAPGSIVYFDFERPHPASMEASVRAFVDGWVSRLHERGQNAGIYGSYLSAMAWQGGGLANPPDAIWPWRLDGRRSVWDLGSLSNDVWNNHQRLHQHTQDVNELNGSHSLRIDRDFADGPVATYTSGPGVSPPGVTTLSSTGVGQSTATFNATVNPNGSATTGYFQYGASIPYASSTAPQNLLAGTASLPMSAAASALTCNTVYHVRAVATNGGGTSNGSDTTFTTAACAGGCSYTAGQGATGSEASAFLSAHAVAGGQAVLGCATGAVGVGFTSWAGTQAHYQNFANGSIEYLLSTGQAYAILQPFFGKWAGMGLDSGNTMGYPSGNQSAPGTSCYGTSFRRQPFEGEAGHLVHSTGSGQVWEIHGLIADRWEQKGYGGCPLGLPVSDERNATASPQGSTGRVSDLEGGHIHFRYGDTVARASWGALDSYYASIGGTASCLGFPTTDVYTDPFRGTPTADFEGGFVYSNDGVNYYDTCGAGPSPPTLTTQGATGVGQTSATLGASVNPHGSTTTVYFDYGTSASFGLVTSVPAGSGSSTTSVIAPVSSLQCNTVYYFRARATNGVGTATGGTLTFSTSACTIAPPTLSTLGATGIGQTSATLGASVNPHGSTTTVYFDYGTSASFGLVTSVPAGSGGSTTSVTAPVSSLQCGTVYYFRSRATNGGGTTTGGTLTFSTSACTIAPPTLTTQGATAVGQASATLGASVNPHGSATTVYFDYGTSASFGLVTSVPAGSGTSTTSVTAPVSSLQCNTLYYFHARATNGGGTTTAGTLTFTTSACPLGPWLHVTFPNGGEALEVGSSYAIRWTAGNLDPSGNIQILYNDGSWHFITAGLAPFVTQHTWTVPATASPVVSLFVGNAVGADWEASDYSDANVLVTRATSFYTVSPCRAVDTRLSPSVPLSAGVARRFTVTDACGIPADACALAVNVTVTQATAAGNLRIYPAGLPMSTTSTLNYAAAVTRANNATLVLGSAGALDAVCAQASGTAHVIVDVTGYYR